MGLGVSQFLLLLLYAELFDVLHAELFDVLHAELFDVLHAVVYELLHAIVLYRLVCEFRDRLLLPLHKLLFPLHDVLLALRELRLLRRLLRGRLCLSLVAEPKSRPEPRQFHGAATFRRHADLH